MGSKDDVHAAWESSKKKLIQLEKWETKMLCNQACINWTEFGDRNSKFFHALIKERRKNKTIELARSDGTLISNAAEIGNEAQTFFADFFSASPYHLDETLFDRIQRSVTKYVTRSSVPSLPKMKFGMLFST